MTSWTLKNPQILRWLHAVSLLVPIFNKNDEHVESFNDSFYF